ncbi:MAG: hypothetical protein AAF620_00180 [Bacteroidota bacterium]
MWSLIKVEATNLMSFEAFSYLIENGVVTTIYGHNKDNDSQHSNGSGKSALLEAIAMGLTGSPLRKVKNGELVRNGAKNSSIYLKLTNSQTNDLMEIERVVYPKKSSVVFVKINGDVAKDVTSTDSVNHFIEEQIGVPSEDIYNYFILSASRFEPFLNVSDTKKKATINRFSNGDIVDQAIEELEKDLEYVQNELAEKDAQIRVMQGKIDVTNESIREALSKEEEKPTLEDKIVEYRRDKAGQVQKKRSLQSALNRIKKEESELAKQLVDFDENEDWANAKADMQDAKEEYNKLIVSIKEKKEQFNTIHSSIRKLEVQLQGTVKCPLCSHEFDVSDEDFSPLEEKKNLASLKEEESMIIEKGKAKNKAKEEIEEEISEIEEELSCLKNAKEKLEVCQVDLKRELQRIESDMGICASRIEYFDLLIADAKEAVEEKVDLISPLRNKVAKLEKELAPLDKKVEEVRREVEQLIFQQDVFKRFKTHLANKSIRSIELLANDYLASIGSDISIRLSGVSRLASGAIRDKIGATLIRDGQEIGSFNKNSNGEKARINLAIILTFNKLINLNAKDGKGLNLLVIDEILDSSDAEGLMAMIGAMNQLNTTVLMVSHGAVYENYEHSITIEKENGESKIAC